MKINHVDGMIACGRRIHTYYRLTQEDHAILAFLQRRGASMRAMCGHDYGVEATEVADHVMGIKCYHDDNAGKKAAAKLRQLARLGLVAYEGWPGRKVWHIAAIGELAALRASMRIRK